MAAAATGHLPDPVQRVVASTASGETLSTVYRGQQLAFATAGDA